MTGYLVPISKAREFTQADIQRQANEARRQAQKLLDRARGKEAKPPAAPAKAAPGAPVKVITRSGLRPRTLVGGGALLAAGGGGSYLYRRKRAEKGLAVDAT